MREDECGRGSGRTGGVSNRTIVELNHDLCPRDDLGSLLKWAEAMAMYMRSGSKVFLPAGVTFKHMRHHSDPDPMQGCGDPS